MPSRNSRKRTRIKPRSAAAAALASPRYHQRVVPAKKKSRGRKRMEEIYAFEWRAVESEMLNDK